MKKSKFNIFCAWILLICFAAGQYMVYIHQHNVLQKTGSAYSRAKNQPKPAAVVQEKCYMCDAMHHTAITISEHACFTPVASSAYIYKTGDYNFISIALVLAAGRAPPAPVHSC